MNKGVFITATGTDVGKTYVTALLVKRLREQGIHAGYFKPALSGAVRRGNRLIPGDTDYVCRTAGLSEHPEDLTAYVFEEAASPHLAAAREGRRIERGPILHCFEKALAQFDFVAAEGCGGLVCPLCMEASPLMLTDVIRLLGLPVLLVADAGLGAIHATCATAAYARQERIPLLGILLNRFCPGSPIHEDNRVQIERLSGLPVLTCVLEDAGALKLDARRLFSL